MYMPNTPAPSGLPSYSEVVRDKRNTALNKEAVKVAATFQQSLESLKMEQNEWGDAEGVKPKELLERVVQVINKNHNIDPGISDAAEENPTNPDDWDWTELISLLNDRGDRKKFIEFNEYFYKIVNKKMGCINNFHHEKTLGYEGLTPVVKCLFDKHEYFSIQDEYDRKGKRLEFFKLFIIAGCLSKQQIGDMFAKVNNLYSYDGPPISKKPRFC